MIEKQKQIVARVQVLVEEFLVKEEYSKAIAASELLAKLVESYASMSFIEKESSVYSSSITPIKPEVEQIKSSQVADQVQPIEQEQIFVQKASYRWNDGWNGKNGNDMWDL